MMPTHGNEYKNLTITKVITNGGIFYICCYRYLHFNDVNDFQNNEVLMCKGLTLKIKHQDLHFKHKNNVCTDNT